MAWDARWPAAGRSGNRLILHGRDQQRLASVAGRHRAARGGRAGDRAGRPRRLAPGARLSEQVAALTDRLDVFVSNAGVGSGEPDGRERRVSADGYELRFAVNYLAGFDLALRLLPLLRAAGSARIVNVASLGQAPIDWDDVMIERDYDGYRAYCQSKLAQITTGFTMAERLDPDVVTVNSLHPSTLMPTKMVVAEYGRSVDTWRRRDRHPPAGRRPGTLRRHREVLRPAARGARSRVRVRPGGAPPALAAEPRAHRSARPRPELGPGPKATVLPLESGRKSLPRRVFGTRMRGAADVAEPDR